MQRCYVFLGSKSESYMSACITSESCCHQSENLRHIVIPKKLLLIEDRVSWHVDRNQQVRMGVQMNHLDVLLWEVSRCNGPVDMRHHLVETKHNDLVYHIGIFHGND